MQTRRKKPEQLFNRINHLLNGIWRILLEDRNALTFAAVKQPYRQKSSSTAMACSMLSYSASRGLSAQQPYWEQYQQYNRCAGQTL